MKTALIFGPWNLAGRSNLDFSNLERDPRGMTGSELSAVRTAAELAKLGHQVELFIPSEPCEWQGVRVRPCTELEAVDDTYDAAVSVNHPDYLRETRARIRACWHLLGSLEYCRPKIGEHVNLWIACSEGHRAMLDQPHVLTAGLGKALETFRPNPADIVTIGLGCDPRRYQSGIKRPGFCVYTSSPDRGLHWALQEWAAIRRAVPHATLQIFYRFAPWHALVGNLGDEQGRRARYIREALLRLRNHGVVLRDAVSQDHLALQLSQAECLAYPCDPMQPTETFGCAVLEGMAARACPVITNADAFGQLYSGHVEMVDRDQPGWVAEWRERVIRVLKDEQFRADCNERAQAFAAKRTWADSARELEGAIRNRLGRMEAA